MLRFTSLRDGSSDGRGYGLFVEASSDMGLSAGDTVMLYKNDVSVGMYDILTKVQPQQRLYHHC